MDITTTGQQAQKPTGEQEFAVYEQGMTEEEAQAFEGTVDAVITQVNRLDRTRNLQYHILELCRKTRRAEEVETFIAALHEMLHSLQEPYVYMDALIDAGGLDSVALDADGNPVDMDAFAAAPEEARAGMIADYDITTTPAGVAALDLLAPKNRMRAKLAEKPERYTTFLAVLDFCREPKTLAEVKRLFEEDSTLNRETTVDRQLLSCDFYLSELERAGGIVWDDGWKCTPEGLEFLRTATG